MQGLSTFLSWPIEQYKFMRNSMWRTGLTIALFTGPRYGSQKATSEESILITSRYEATSLILKIPSTLHRPAEQGDAIPLTVNLYGSICATYWAVSIECAQHLHMTF